MVIIKITITIIIIIIIIIIITHVNCHGQKPYGVNICIMHTFNKNNKISILQIFWQ